MQISATRHSSRVLSELTWTPGSASATFASGSARANLDRGSERGFAVRVDGRGFEGVNERGHYTRVNERAFDNSVRGRGARTKQGCQAAPCETMGRADASHIFPPILVPIRLYQSGKTRGKRGGRPNAQNADVERRPAKVIINRI